MKTRREFLTAAAGAASALAAPARRAAIKVGITVDTRPDWNGPENFMRSIDEASAAGYHNIETFWNYVERWEQNPRGLADELSKRDLKLETVSNSGPLHTDFVDPSQRDAVIEDHMRLVRFIEWFRCDHLKINIGGQHRTVDRTSDYKVMARTFNELGKRINDHEMKFGVHAHLGSALQTKQDVDAIMERTDPKLVHLIVDTGHVSMAGMDPVELTRTYLHRIIEFHIKDVAPENKGGFKGRLEPPYNTTADNRIFFELGKGGVDFVGIKKILDDSQWQGWWTVELDRTGTTAKESCVIAKKYLEKLGLAI